MYRGTEPGTGGSALDRFLIQVSANTGYANIIGSGRYENEHWMNKRRDTDHGEVKPGDELLIYCTGDVPNHGMSLAFSVAVRDVSPDHVTFDLDEPHWFPSPLGRTALHSLVAEGRLQGAFRSCGAQGFNITKLDLIAAQQVLGFVEEPIAVQDGEARSPGSPADRLIEVHLEQWLVDHWNQVKFGAPLKIYEEDGQPVGQQYDTGTVGRIDLLCEDTATGALVVIELKKGQQSDAVIGQLARYMGWVKEHLARGRDVEGVVLTPSYNERLRYATRAVPGSRLLRYETRFEIFPQDA